MKLSVVIPVGPGHEAVSQEAVKSVNYAFETNPGIFDDLEIIVIDDTGGHHGRSAARNAGLDKAAGEWTFLLDADDLMESSALWNAKQFDFLKYSALFGDIYVQRSALKRPFLVPENQERAYATGYRPSNDVLNSWNQLLNGPVGTLSMGCFLKTDEAKKHRFHEELDAGEDHEFYISFLCQRAFIKIPTPIVTIRQYIQSATGPKGRTPISWNVSCKPIFDFWKNRGEHSLDNSIRLQSKYWEQQDGA